MYIYLFLLTDNKRLTNTHYFYEVLLSWNFKNLSFKYQYLLQRLENYKFTFLNKTFFFLAYFNHILNN
jgi:hypothetical protein